MTTINKIRQQLNSNPEFPTERVTFLNVSLMIFGATVIMKICFAMWTSTMASSDLFSIQGTIENIYIGGKGRPTYIDVLSSGNVDRYRSLLGKVWPGMPNLKKGDLISITAWEQGQAGEYRDPYPHYYIWEMSKGSEIIIRGEEMSKLKKQNENDINTFADWSLLFGTILAGVAYIRHKKLQASNDIKRPITPGST